MGIICPSQRTWYAEPFSAAFSRKRRTLNFANSQGASFTPGSLNLTISGDTSGSLRTVLFQRRNGNYVLAIWLPESVDNGVSSAAPESITVSGLSSGTYAVSDPTVTGSFSGAQALSHGSFSITAGPNIQLVRITGQ